jgi:glycosyltransferase involved in cell wall biosynthesis
MHLLRTAVAAGHAVELWTLARAAPDPPEPVWPGLEVRRYEGRMGTSAWDGARIVLSPMPAIAWRAQPGAAFHRRLHGPAEVPVDVAVLEQADVASFGPVLERCGVPYVVDAQNVESDLLAQYAARLPRWTGRSGRLRYLLDARKYRPLERRLFSRAAAVAAVSEEDRARILGLAPTANVVVHPSGVDLGYHAWNDHRRNVGDALVMTASFNHPPNVDAAEWLAREIMPAVRRAVPGATASLVGFEGARTIGGLHAPRDGVVVRGAVPDVRPELAGADLFVCPLRIGGGTRLKILEALACGLPVLATPLAVEGLGLEGRDLVLLAETPEEFAAQARDALGDQDLRARLSVGGRAFVESRYDWEAIGSAFVETLTSVARRREPQPS